MNEHEEYMKEALALAREAMAEGEVPVGCVIVRKGRIIGRGRNRRETDRNALAHAEIEAIKEACTALGGWRLPDCTLYVTLEPCPMCAGAIVNARIDRAVIALPDPKAGALGSVINFNSYPLNHKVALTYGVMKDEAREYMQSFFAELRKRIRKS